MSVNVLERIAYLIRENPSITVHEIATRLGYSEEKSIYYWLDKSRYSGIKEFKKAVLTSEFDPAGDNDYEDQVREPDTFMLYPSKQVPVIDEFSACGEPVYAQARSVVSHSQQLSSDVFAYTIDTGEYAPMIMKSDLVIVDPSPSPASGDMLMLWIPPRTVLLRRYFGMSERSFFIHPITGTELLTEMPSVQPRIVGRVLHIIRTL